MKVTFHMYTANGVLDVRVDGVHSGQLFQNPVAGHWVYGCFADRSETTLVGEGADVETAMSRCRWHLARPSRPTPPTVVNFDGDPTIAVTPVGEVTWSEEYEAWICLYRTEDAVDLRAVWSARRGAWEPAA